MFSRCVIFLMLLFRSGFAQIYQGDNTLYEGERCFIGDNLTGQCKYISQCPSAIRQLVELNLRPQSCSYEGFMPVVCCPTNKPPSNLEGQLCKAQSGGSGSCRTIYQCRDAVKESWNTAIIPPICGYDGSSVFICCPDKYGDRVQQSSNQIQKRISEKKCMEYKICEAVVKLQVEGGVNSDLDEFPHMAAIGWPLVDGDDVAWNCGGSLISEDYVLTAAHCTLISDDTTLKSEQPTMVRLGELNIKSDDDNANPINIEINYIILHPDYKAPSKYNDIALIELAESVTFSNGIRPICLWQYDEIPSNSAQAIGWGKIGRLAKSSDILQKVDLQIFDNESCKNVYRTNRQLKNGIVDEQLCAGDENGGKDTCQGDSGGPLQIADKQYSCSYHLIGLTSFGIGCGGKNTPAVYTRISSYIDWIENEVWEE